MNRQRPSARQGQKMHEPRALKDHDLDSERLKAMEALWRTRACSQVNEVLMG
jgi:hypothetical protein